MVEDQPGSVSHLRLENSNMCLQAASTGSAITQQTCGTNAGQNVYVEQLRALNFVLRFQRGNGDQCVDFQATGTPVVMQKPCLYDGTQNLTFIE
jgi:hypothetical protein